jgi:hypothetical protein
MPDSDIALAKKRLARSLRTHFCVQIVALCAIGAVCYFRDSFPGMHPNRDFVHRLFEWLLITPGVLLFLYAALCVRQKLIVATFVPSWVWLYALGIGLFFIVLLLSSSPTFFILIYFFPFYVVVPLPFIAYWLAKTAEEEESKIIQD